jgi:hypothetical protein
LDFKVRLDVCKGKGKGKGEGKGKGTVHPITGHKGAEEE